MGGTRVNEPLPPGSMFSWDDSLFVILGTHALHSGLSAEHYIALETTLDYVYDDVFSVDVFKLLVKTGEARVIYTPD